MSAAAYSSWTREVPGEGCLVPDHDAEPSYSDRSFFGLLGGLRAVPRQVQEIFRKISEKEDEVEGRLFMG